MLAFIILRLIQLSFMSVDQDLRRCLFLKSVDLKDWSGLNIFDSTFSLSLSLAADLLHLNFITCFVYFLFISYKNHRK